MWEPAHHNDNLNYQLCTLIYGNLNFGGEVWGGESTILTITISISITITITRLHAQEDLNIDNAYI